jgi:hypothetical protein
MRAIRREDRGGQNGKTSPEKGRTAGRNLTIFKSLVLTVLVVITFYGMLNRGLVGVERWLPVAAAILGLVFITLFVADYFADVPRIAWVLVGLLVVLVAVKGLSLTWSIGRTETVQELLRSSVYLAAFALGGRPRSLRGGWWGRYRWYEPDGGGGSRIRRAPEGKPGRVLVQTVPMASGLAPPWSTPTPWRWYGVWESRSVWRA